jgi:uncharacterized protein involved in type VI secretion and phage assembly
VARERTERAGRIDGVVTGVVAENLDPEALGRVQVAFTDPRLGGSAWARVATPMAGDGRGVYLLPEVGDHVLVAFEHGDRRSPFVVGALWGENEEPPERNEDGRNNKRTIRSRSGHLIRLDDTEGAEKVEVVDSTGGASVVLDSAARTITVEAQGDLTIRSKGGTLRLEGLRIEIRAGAVIDVRGQQVQVAGAALTTIKGGMVRIN